jgi:hypothetical protein
LAPSRAPRNWPAWKEIYDLTYGDDSDLAVMVLGLLTAAAGPLSVRDLVALRSDGQGAPTPLDTKHVRRLVEDRAARSLERVGAAGGLDLKAATAAVTLPHHIGRTEGVNNKTKIIKRQMYGRAGFGLLRHRILLG